MSTINIHIVRSGLLTSVQDRGRHGYRYYGIPCSGYLDQHAASRALELVGNPCGSSVLEINQLGPSLYFEQEAWVALTGARIKTSIPMDQPIKVLAGTTIHLKETYNGMRTYLAIKGEWKVPQFLGSTSAYSYPSIGIGRLEKGDTLTIEASTATLSHETSNYIPRDYEAKDRIRLFKGPEYDCLEELSKQHLFAQSYSLSPKSNRMAAIVIGTKINCTKLQIDSSAVFPGTIQLLPNGSMAVLLQDGQTTGGYPRIGLIHSEDLDDFNQIRTRQEFKFQQIRGV